MQEQVHGSKSKIVNIDVSETPVTTSNELKEMLDLENVKEDQVVYIPMTSSIMTINHKVSIEENKEDIVMKEENEEDQHHSLSQS